MRTRSAHGYRLAERYTRWMAAFKLTRISNCHNSSPLSSVLTHSSGVAIQPSRSFGLSGMKRETRNVTAVSTKSRERAENPLVRTEHWISGTLAQSMFGLCFPRRGPLSKTLLEKNHPGHEHANREYGSWGV